LLNAAHLPGFSNFTPLQPEQCRQRALFENVFVLTLKGLRQCVIAVCVWWWKLCIWSAPCQCELACQFSYAWRRQESSWCLFQWQISVCRTCTYKTYFCSLLFLFYKAYVILSDCLSSLQTFEWLLL